MNETFSIPRVDAGLSTKPLTLRNEHLKHGFKRWNNRNLNTPPKTQQWTYGVWENVVASNRCGLQFICYLGL